MSEIKPALPWLECILRYHETGGYEGDGSDWAMRKARAELDGVPSLLTGLREAREVIKWFAGLAHYLPADMDDAEYCDQDEVVLQAGHLRRAAATLAKLDTLLSQEGGHE